VSDRSAGVLVLRPPAHPSFPVLESPADALLRALGEGPFVGRPGRVPEAELNRPVQSGTRSRQTRYQTYSQGVRIQPGTKRPLSLSRCVPGPVPAACPIRSRRYLSCGLIAHAIDTRKLSTMPMATISSQLVLFFIPFTPHRCLPIGQGQAEAVPIRHAAINTLEPGDLFCRSPHSAHRRWV